MSKELEALSYIIRAVDNAYNELEFDEYVDLLKQALTPPTQEEICKELKEYCGCHVKFLKDRSFVDTFGYEIVALDALNNIWFNESLPPRLARRVSQFYESLEEKK